MEQVIILAAGKGSRLRGNVKTLLKINGKTLLQRIIDTFPDLPICVVTGFKSEEIEREIDLSRVSVVHNPQWHSTDNAFSLYCALLQKGCKDSFVINGDTIFDPEIIDVFKWEPNRVAVFI